MPSSSIGNLRPLTPKMLMANTATNIIGYSDGCTSIDPIGTPDDWQAPSTFRRLSTLGPVYRQFYRVQCDVQYPGRQSKKGKPKKVILCWSGISPKGLRATEPLPGRPGEGSPVWVSCSCNYFRYVCEWALSRYGSSDIIYSNGQPARFTNPKGVGTLCKHIYKVLPFAINSWSGESPEVKSVDEEQQEVPALPVVKTENPEVVKKRLDLAKKRLENASIQLRRYDETLEDIEAEIGSASDQEKDSLRLKSERIQRHKARAEKAENDIKLEIETLNSLVPGINYGEGLEVNQRGASFTLASSGLYLPNYLVPSRLSQISRNLRSLALSFDTECC